MLQQTILLSNYTDNEDDSVVGETNDCRHVLDIRIDSLVESKSVLTIEIVGGEWKSSSK